MKTWIAGRLYLQPFPGMNDFLPLHLYGEAWAKTGYPISDFRASGPDVNIPRKDTLSHDGVLDEIEGSQLSLHGSFDGKLGKLCLLVDCLTAQSVTLDAVRDGTAALVSAMEGSTTAVFLGRQRTHEGSEACCGVSDWPGCSVEGYIMPSVPALRVADLESFLPLPSSILLTPAGFRFHDVHRLSKILSMTKCLSSPDVMAESVQETHIVAPLKFINMVGNRFIL